MNTREVSLGSDLSVARRNDITIERAPVGIAHFAPDGRFVFVNPQLCTLFGYSREELLTMTFQEISFADDLPHCMAMIEQLGAGTIPQFSHEKRFERNDGTFIYTRVIVTAVREESGAVAFFLGIIEDLSQQWAIDQARQAAIRSRDEVLAVVAHDLRNPVHTILMSAAVAELPTISASERDKQLGVIRRTARAMDRLIRDLLDVTQIEMGQLAIHPQPIAIEGVIDEIIAVFAPRAAAAGLRLIGDVGSNLPEVSADRERITQVLNNLVGNSLKFTPEGGAVTISAHARNGGIEVAVADTGNGIPPGQLPDLFRRYWQADRGAHRGVGLGLAIVHGIVEAHGGKIDVESTVGKGTTFRFTLPA